MKKLLFVLALVLSGCSYVPINRLDPAIEKIVMAVPEIKGHDTYYKLYIINPDGNKQLVPNSTLPGMIKNVKWANNGKNIIFYYEGPWHYLNEKEKGVYVVDENGENLKPILKDIYHFAVLPDSKTLIYRQSIKDYFVVNYDGTGKRLPQGEEINYLKIDVKGIRYYYSQDRSKMLWAELNNIYVSNKDLSGKWQLNKDAGYMNIRLYFNPMWDRRDNKIYYYLDHYSEFTGDNRGIMEINADGSGERMILGLEPLGIEFTGNYWYTSNLDISFDIFNK